MGRCLKGASCEFVHQVTSASKCATSPICIFLKVKMVTVTDSVTKSDKRPKLCTCFKLKIKGENNTCYVKVIGICNTLVYKTRYGLHRSPSEMWS